MRESVQEFSLERGPASHVQKKKINLRLTVDYI